MLILAAILISLITPFAVLGLSFSKLRLGYIWLLTTISSSIAWGMVYMSRDLIPFSITLANWQTGFSFSTSPTFLLDNISWPFAMAVMTLPLAVLLTDVARENNLDPQTWAASQALGAVGLIAVVAGNPITVLMTWAIIDIAESVVLLLRMTRSSERERVVISFSVRIAGMLVLISAMLRATGLNRQLTFDDIPAEVGGYLMLAAGLRLGILPPNQPLLREPFLRRGLGTLVRFIPVIASLILLVRAAHVEIEHVWVTIFMILASSSAILSAMAWVRAKSALEGRLYWILGLSAFALASAVQGLPVACAAWGLALFFSGSILFLFNTRNLWLMILPSLGIVGFSALPLTPAWEGSALFGRISWGYQIIFFASLALFVIGYFRFARQSRPASQGFERWMWLAYLFGLSLLPITHYSLIYIRWKLGFREIFIQTPGWVSGLIPMGLAAILIVLNRRKLISLPPYVDHIFGVFDWVYRFIWWVYRILGRILFVITRLLEGEGSVLWALLILIMLIVTVNLWGSGEVLEL